MLDTIANDQLLLVYVLHRVWGGGQMFENDTDPTNANGSKIKK